MINSVNENTTTHSHIVDPTDENIKKCAEIIKQGGVVGFPTETVYGLGANALNIEAVKKIFEYKGRPLSDPLIVHVTSVDMAKSLINIDEETCRLFTLLSNKFWPGPLTLVLKANFDVISPILTANTEYIGIRYPNNEIARKLIDFSEVPIAAPSANKFCHVSPVNPYHVYEDFKEFPISIINGGTCNFRMESTVVKILKEEKKIQILRMGAISPEQISEFLLENEIEYTVEVFKKIITDDIEEKVYVKNVTELSQEAPGQFAKHYSPLIDTFILDEAEPEIQFNLANVVFLDYKKFLSSKYKLGKFLHLSESGDPCEVMLNIYDSLHTAEKVENAQMIVLCDLLKHMEDNPHKQTLVDRMSKAAAFKRINIKP